MSASESQSSLEREQIILQGEKNTAVTTPANALDLEKIGETSGYTLDKERLKEQYGVTDLKTAKDGKTVLIPQPSDDPTDPLNWPAWKKAVVLLTISIASCAADYGSATGAVTLLPQAKDWHLSPNTVNHATAGNVFMLGAGGLFAVWLSNYFGRLPVFVFFQCWTVGTAAWCAAATNFESYMAARILNGFFSASAAGGGLMWIKDMFFFHEHPRKINLWATALIFSPFLAPLVTALIITNTTWRWAFWVDTILAATALILTLLFVDETYYPRHLAAGQRPVRGSRLMRLIGVEQRRTKLIPNTLFSALQRPAIAISKLPVLLSTVYYFFTFAWVIGNNTTISVFIVPLYEWTYTQLAIIYVAPCVGLALGLILGHWFHDLIGSMYAKRHAGVIEPEARLIIIWFATPLIVVGMNMIGATLQHKLHWAVLAVGWAIHNFAIITVTTALNAYCLDAYPEGSGEVAAWLNAGRTMGGFVVGYFQLEWAAKTGTQTEFGVQSAICVVAFGIIILLQFYGKKLRHAQGTMTFKTQ